MLTRVLLLATGLWLPLGLFGQQTLNANFGNFSFRDANRSFKIGNGQSTGNITLYTNVITIGSQSIDCIVHTLNISNGSFSLPGSAPSGTTPFDYGSATGSGLTGNDNRFFSPTFNFSSSGGSCRFRFEFIAGGTYNNTTRTGTRVILQNVFVNTYDIDGNGNTGSNQYNDFGGFSQTQVGNGTNITITYNPSTGLTRFASNTHENIADIRDDRTRVRTQFGSISTFEVVVGGRGSAYFFLDVGTGFNWTATPATLSPPILDLNTLAAGIDNNALGCTGPKALSQGSPNISSVSTEFVNDLSISFPVSDITDIGEEAIVPNISNPTLNKINLCYNQNNDRSFTIGSTTYVVRCTITGDTRRVSFTGANGILSKAEAEKLLDALHYFNFKSSPTSGTRNFSVTIRNGSFESPPALFQVEVSCTILPVIGWQINATPEKGAVRVEWSTEQEIETDYFQLERSCDGNDFSIIQKVQAAGNSSSRRYYQYLDKEAISGKSNRIYYRIRQVDLNGTAVYSKVISVILKQTELVSIRNNPFRDQLILDIRSQSDRSASLEMIDAVGRVVRKKNLRLRKGTDQVVLSGLHALPAGVYCLRLFDDKESSRLTVLKQ